VSACLRVESGVVRRVDEALLDANVNKAEDSVVVPVSGVRVRAHMPTAV
jgi:hypothetical protein